MTPAASPGHLVAGQSAFRSEFAGIPLICIFFSQGTGIESCHLAPLEPTTRPTGIDEKHVLILRHAALRLYRW